MNSEPSPTSANNNSNENEASGHQSPQHGQQAQSTDSKQAGSSGDQADKTAAAGEVASSAKGGKPGKGACASTGKPANATGKPAKAGKKRSLGWVPNQHGAWGMLITPIVVGMIFSGLSLGQLLLSVTWIVGYFFFFASNVWLRSKMKPQHLKPVLVYGTVTAIAGFSALAMGPSLLFWLPVFLPLVAVAFYESYQRRERSILARLATIIAAGFMLAVYCSSSSLGSTIWSGLVFDVMSPADVLSFDPSTWLLWFITGNMTAFFILGLLYVRTIVRELGNGHWLIMSVAGHIFMVLVTAFWLLKGIEPACSWLLPVTWSVLTLRAYLVPMKANSMWTTSKTRLSLKRVGYSELLFSILIVVVSTLGAVG